MQIQLPSEGRNEGSGGRKGEGKRRGERMGRKGCENVLDLKDVQKNHWRVLEPKQSFSGVLDLPGLGCLVTAVSSVPGLEPP